MVRPLIELERVAHRYPGGHEALRDCSLAIRPGQRHALLGTNGAGKTTLLQHLTRTITATRLSPLGPRGRPHEPRQQRHRTAHAGRAGHRARQLFHHRRRSRPARLRAHAVALRRADVVIGGARTLALLAHELKPDAVRHDLTGRLSAVPDWVREAREAQRHCVVLATGDPLCHGIAPYLAQHLCVQALDILPNLSTLQLACARIGLAWQDARIVSVHSRDAGEWVPGSPPAHGLYALAQALRAHDRVLVLTSPDNGPDRIARLLLAEGLGDDFQMAVAEHLLQPQERVLAELRPPEAAVMRFAALNVVLLWRLVPAPRPVRFGLPDQAYAQRQPDKGLITKQEVRAVSLARLQLRADSVVWDIGAGSGSVGLSVRTIAGVNAFTAACADVGTPLAEQDDTVAIVPAAYGVDAVDRLLADFDTLVLMKVKPLLDELIDWLQTRGLLTGAHFIERVGAPDERRLSGAGLLALRGTKVSYLSLLIVKNPHRVRGERIKGCLKKEPPAPSIGPRSTLQETPVEDPV